MNFDIGKKVTLDVDLDKIMAHKAVVDGLVAFAVKQVLTNAHASITADVEPDEAKRTEQAKAAAQKRLDAWYEGTFTRSERGPRGDEVMREMRDLATAEIKADYEKKVGKWSKLDPKVAKAVAEKHLVANEARFRKAAEARLAIKPETAEDATDIMALLASVAPKAESATE